MKKGAVAALNIQKEINLVGVARKGALMIGLY